MKIQCEQCKVEYTIDDASIGDRGIRAQCPRCNHITTIRKSNPALVDQARAKLGDSAICVNCGKPCDPNPNDPIPICQACQALGGEVGAKTTVSGGQQLPPSNPGMQMPPMSSPSNPVAGLPGFGSPGGGGAMPGFGGTPDPSFGGGNGTEGLPGFGGGGGTPEWNGGGELGADSLPPAPVYVPPTAPAEETAWKIKKSPSGEIYGPFDRDLIGGWIESDKIVPADEICRVGGAWAIAAEHEDFKEIFAARYRLPTKPEQSTESVGGPKKADAIKDKPQDLRTNRGGAMAMAAQQLGKTGGRSRGIPRGVIFGALGALGVVAVVAGVWASGIVGKIGKGITTVPTPLVDDETEKQLNAFAREFPNVTGTAAEHLAAAKQAMATDSVVGFRNARREFGMALAVDRKNLEALGGIAEADALLGQYDDQTNYLREAVELSGKAVERAPTNPEINRAKAAALIASKGPANYADARTILTTRVMVKGSADAVSTAMLGVAWRNADDAKAEENLKKATALNPNLVRPRVELGLLYESQNRFQKALETFKPIAAKSALAGFHAGVINEKVGKYKEAAAAYDAAAKVAEGEGGGRAWAEARLASAVIQYQALDKTKEAAASLAPVEAKLASGDLKLKPELESRLKLHLSILARLSGSNEGADRAIKLAHEVIGLGTPEYVSAAHFASGLAKLRKADFVGSDRDLEEAETVGLSGRQKSEIYFWQAQLKARRGDQGAGAKFDDASHADGENWRAIVAHAGMMAEAADQEIAALDKMQELSHLDPEFFDGYGRVTLYFPDPSSDVLAKALKSFERIYPSHAVDSRASTALGMITFLQKNPARAKRYIDAAMSESEPDEGAVIYSGILAEQRGDCRTALVAYNGAKVKNPSAFLSMVIGRCSLKTGRLEEAAASLSESLQINPFYAPAQYWLGVTLQKRGDKKGAVAKWGDALRNDPNYLRASQAIAEQDGV